jgi:hypothetical protein
MIRTVVILAKYNCALTKLDWFAACIALRVDGAVLVVFLWRWCKICTRANIARNTLFVV